MPRAMRGSADRRRRSDGETNARVGRRLFFQMLLQEGERALPGELCRRFVIAAALVTEEAVLRVRIDEDLAIAAAFLFDHLDVAHRDRGVLFAEMQLRRHLRLL